MGRKTKVSWAHHTFNGWWGCEKVSEACAHCYAEAFAKRLGRKLWGPGTDRAMQRQEYWQQLLRWNAAAKRDGERRRVFTASMSDVFEDHPQVGSARGMLFRYVELCHWLDFLFLTKRPENIMSMVPHHWRDGFPQNVWIMTTVETQKWAEIRIPILLKVPGIILGLSCEPLLEKLDLSPWLDQLDWVIVGDESGPKRRPTPVDWVRSMRDQCIEEETAFFLKQLHIDRRKIENPILDGRQWIQVPK